MQATRDTLNAVCFSSTRQSVRYRIQPGDNLSTLAELYRTTVSEIRRVNQLQDNRIIEGRTLIIPVGTREDTIASLPQKTLM